MKWLCIQLIGLYQAAISPFFGHCCRFTPTCSEYAKMAIEKYGPLKGLWKAAQRLSKCHPFHRGGLDEP